jgi:potassium-dependent mechanosensitive channel
VTVKWLAKKPWRAGALFLCAAILAALLGAAPALCADDNAPAPPARPGGLAPAFPSRPAAVAPAAPDDSAAPVDSAARLDAAKQSLDQIEKLLLDDTLTDAILAKQHDAVEPVKKQIQAAIADLTPKLAAIKARLDQLGAAPDAKANPPPAPEDPAVTQDRADQSKLYAATDDLLKRANLLQVRADQLDEQIVARRRALFANAVFQQGTSIVAPGLWLDVARESPRGFNAARAVLDSFWRRAASALSDGAVLPFLSLLLLLVVALTFLIFGARRVIPRDDSRHRPNGLQKAAAALWTFFAVSVIPFVGVSAFYTLANWFGLYDPQWQPVDSALFWGVIRCAVAAGLATAIFAPNRELWRPIDLSDRVALKLRRMAVTVAVLISLGKLLEAVNEVIGASVQATMATRGAYALLVGIIMARGLYRVVAVPDDPADEGATRLAQAENQNPWWAAIRVALWMAIAAMIIADLIGYIALSAFIVGQLAWTAVVAGLLFLLLKLTREGAEQAFRPGSRFSRGLIASLGVRRESLQQIGALLSAAATVTLCVFAAILAAAPWGVHSQDMLGAIKSAFVGVQVGEVTISLSSSIVALLLFTAGYVLTRTAQNWLEDRYLPLTQLDTGLRASIRTSIGYIGVLASLVFALAYLGINTERLALVAGALSVGIGLGLQSVVNNFVSGLILLWERAIRVGDWVLIGTDQGYVRRINVRSTEIETFDRATMIVPNAIMFAGVVKNFVRGDRVGRLVIPVSVLWGADPEKVREVLFEAAKSHDEVVGIPTPSVLFTNISSSSLDFELVCFVEEIERAARVKSDLHYTIFRRFEEAGLRLNPPPSGPQTLTLDLAQIEPLVRQYGGLKDIKT